MQCEPSHPAFGELLDVVRSACERSQQAYFTPGDFCYRWHTEITPESPPAARIWTGPDGRAAAFAWLSEGQAHLILRLRSGHVCRTQWTSSEEELLAWAERRHAGSVPRASGTALKVMALESDVRRRALLARRGYRQTDLVLVRRSRMLDCPIAAPSFPEGFALEYFPSATDEDHERWAAAYRKAFEPEQMSVALRRAVTAVPLYRPELDLALRAPDGSLAAFALVWFDEATLTGTFEPVG